MFIQLESLDYVLMTKKINQPSAESKSLAITPTGTRHPENSIMKFGELKLT